MVATKGVARMTPELDGRICALLEKAGVATRGVPRSPDVNATHSIPDGLGDAKDPVPDPNA